MGKKEGEDTKERKEEVELGERGVNTVQNDEQAYQGREEMEN